MGEERKVYKVLVGKPEGKRPHGRPRYRWEEGRDLTEDRGIDGRLESGWIFGRLAGDEGCVERIYLAQDRDRWPAFMNVVIHLRVLVPRN
jgi:hypothetical protein